MRLNKTGMLLTVVLLLITVAVSTQAKQETNKSGTKDKKAATMAKKDDKSATQAATHTVVIYYLYTQPRCVSCRNLEAFTKEAIEKAFKKELEDGSLVWKPVDLKAEGNWHYVEDFQLRSKSVVLADYKGKKEDKEKLLGWRNLERAWELLGDKPGFLKYIQEETLVCLEQKYNVATGEDKTKPKEGTEKKDKSGK